MLKLLKWFPLRIRFEEPLQKYRHPGGEWTLIGLCLAALGLPFLLTPSVKLLGTHTQLGLPPCFFQSLTKLPCPFCGATTSFALIVRGQWQQAFLANPWGPIIYLALIVFSGICFVAIFKNRRVRVEINLSFKGLCFLFLLLWVGKLWVWLFQRF